ncbi:golgin subfamily A member 6-like protein 22 [Branchiostoma lanceolatum]|uniref:golgin subfamily A member 6-like protein 22 n=1 Tax=Branchiostoma lanceolatum TaxID=7740 RepID=UPI003452C4F0
MAEAMKPLRLEGPSASGPRAEETPPDAGMTEAHCRQLRQHRAALVAHMSPGHVLPVLVSLGVISLDTQEEISSTGTRQDINERLLSLLPTKGDRGFHGLCQGLREGGQQGYLAGLLESPPEASRPPVRHELGDTLQPRTKDELITRLETQLRHTRQSLEALQQTRIQAVQQGDPAGKLQASETQLQALQAKLEALENKLSQREREKRERHSRHSNLKENFKKYREGKEKTIETLKKEHRQSSLLKTKCNQQKQEIAQLKSKVSDLEKALRKANKRRDGKTRTKKTETKATMTEGGGNDQGQDVTPHNDKENFRVEVRRQQRASLQRIHLRHDADDTRDVTAAGDSSPAVRRQENSEVRVQQAAARRRRVHDEGNRQAALLRQREDRAVRRRGDTGLEREYRRDTADSRNKFEALLSQSSS